MGNKGAGQAPQWEVWGIEVQGASEGPKWTECTGWSVPCLVVVAGRGTGGGARAVVGIWASLGGGCQAEGSFAVLGSKGGRKWKLSGSGERS